MTYTEAVKKAISGDKEGWNFLCEETYKGCSHTALKMMGNKDDADDVLHDAYMRAFKALSQLDNPEAFAGWMNRIVTTTALNAINSQKKQPVNFSAMEEDKDGEEFNYEVEDTSTDTQPELHYSKEETTMLVNELLSVLNDDQRAAIIANVYSGITTREIAESLGISENTVKARIKQGKDKMQIKAEEMKKKGYTFTIAPLAFLAALLKSEGKAYACELPKAIASIVTAGAAAKEAAKAGFLATTIGKVTAAVAGVVVVGGIAVGIAVSNKDTASDVESVQPTSIEASAEIEANEMDVAELASADINETETEDETAAEEALEIEKKKPVKVISTYEGYHSYTAEYTYDSDSRVAQTHTVHGDGSYVVNCVYTYGEEGYTVDSFLGDGTPNGSSVYDGNGNCLKSIDADGNLQHEAKYDVNGENYYYKIYFDGEGKVTTDGELDSEGRVVKRMDYGIGDYFSTTSYSYDSEGRLFVVESDSGNRRECSYDEEGRLIAVTGGENKEYEYNDRGDLAKITYSYASEEFPFEADVKVYDEEGNLLREEVYYINDYETGGMYLMSCMEYVY